MSWWPATSLLCAMYHPSALYFTCTPDLPTESPRPLLPSKGINSSISFVIFMNTQGPERYPRESCHTYTGPSTNTYFCSQLPSCKTQDLKITSSSLPTPCWVPFLYPRKPSHTLTQGTIQVPTWIRAFPQNHMPTQLPE